jgi:hypothetical protein
MLEFRTYKIITERDFYMLEAIKKLCVTSGLSGSATVINGILERATNVEQYHADDGNFTLPKESGA